MNVEKTEVMRVCDDEMLMNITMKASSVEEVDLIEKPWHKFSLGCLV